MNEEIQPKPGMDVVGTDGEKVGSVKYVMESDYIVVSKGLFFPTDNKIPVSAISSTDHSTVYLRVTKADAMNQGWDADSGSDDDPGLIDADGTTTVPLFEEVVDFHTEDVELAEVQIEKNVVKEEVNIDVPVSEERVNVSRSVVDREVKPGETAFEEETIRVPVFGEEVQVVKRTRVREEIEITKERVDNVTHISETVRREEASVVDNGDVVIKDESRDL